MAQKLKALRKAILEYQMKDLVEQVDMFSHRFRVDSAEFQDDKVIFTVEGEYMDENFRLCKATLHRNPKTKKFIYIIDSQASGLCTFDDAYGLLFYCNGVYWKYVAYKQELDRIFKK